MAPEDFIEFRNECLCTDSQKTNLLVILRKPNLFIYGLLIFLTISSVGNHYF